MKHRTQFHNSVSWRTELNPFRGEAETFDLFPSWTLEGSGWWIDEKRGGGEFCFESTLVRLRVARGSTGAVTPILAVISATSHVVGACPSLNATGKPFHLFLSMTPSLPLQYNPSCSAIWAGRAPTHEFRQASYWPSLFGLGRHLPTTSASVWFIIFRQSPAATPLHRGNDYACLL